MIKVTFTDEIEIITSTEHLYQWDVGQVLEIDGLNVGTPMVHFGVKGDTTGYAVQSQLIDGKLRCGIPDTTLQSGKQIIAYVYVSAGASKYTEKVILIPVVERNKPNNYRTVNMDEVTETQSFLDSMVERLTSLEKRVPISFWAGTQAEYNKIEQKQNNCLYIVTDDDINEKFTSIETNIKTLTDFNKSVKGSVTLLSDGESIGTLSYIRTGKAIQLYGDIYFSNSVSGFGVVYLVLQDNNNLFVPPKTTQYYYVNVQKEYSDNTNKNDVLRINLKDDRSLSFTYTNETNLSRVILHVNITYLIAD